MSEVDPAALSRPDPLDAVASSSKAITNGATTTTKASKALPTAPRVDLEPFYTEIKGAIGDDWSTYKDSISRFVFGGLNQVELSTAIEPFIFVDHKRENLHNQLVCGIYANILRDAPDTPVAPWVSANDKPIAGPKPAAGDLVEQRLKHEIMQLPARTRHRMKGIRDDPRKPLTRDLHANARALAMSPSTSSQTLNPTPLSALDAPASTATGLNRDIEIRRRYNLPLLSEVHDLPPSSSNALHDRALPICYEEGLPAGIADPEASASLLNAALSVFTKDTLTSWMRRTRCDMPLSRPPHVPSVKAGSSAPMTLTNGGLMRKPAPPEATRSAGWGGIGHSNKIIGVKTGAFKRRFIEEETDWRNGGLDTKRSEAGLYPVEVESTKTVGKGRAIKGDMALMWELGDEVLRNMVPWVGERLRWDDGMTGAGEETIQLEDGDGRRGLPLVNGVGNGLTKGAKAAGMANGVTGSKRKHDMINGNGHDAGRPTVNGVNGTHATAGVDQSESWGWKGATKADQKVLDALLDECLDF